MGVWISLGSVGVFTLVGWLSDVRLTLMKMCLNWGLGRDVKSMAGTYSNFSVRLSGGWGTP